MTAANSGIDSYGMRRWIPLAATALLALSVCSRPASAASGRPDLVRELLRQQSSAERSVCGGIRRTLAAGIEADLVVRTAIELGYAPCPVIRCAVEAGADLGEVVMGASEAGATPEVVSRCAVDAGADPGVVARLIADDFRDPSFCYFGPEGGSSASALTPFPSGGNQRYDRAEFSRFQP